MAAHRPGRRQQLGFCRAGALLGLCPAPAASQSTSHVPRAESTSTAGCWRGHLGDTHQVEELLQLLVGVVDAELLKAVELKHLKPAGRDTDEQDRATPTSQELQVATDPTPLQGQALPQHPAGGHRPMAGAGPRSPTQRGREEPSLPVDVQDANGGVVALR